MHFLVFEQFYRKAVNIKMSEINKYTLFVKDFYSKKVAGLVYFIYRDISSRPPPHSSVLLIYAIFDSTSRTISSLASDFRFSNL
jgi:hypothetical protein